jgi:hypothetical protein
MLSGTPLPGLIPFRRRLHSATETYGLDPRRTCRSQLAGSVPDHDTRTDATGVRPTWGADITESVGGVTTGGVRSIRTRTDCHRPRRPAVSVA